MERLIAQIFNGLSLGSIYVLLVTGFNLLLLVAMIIHFSFPVIIVFSMFMSWIVITATGSIFLGILMSIITAIGINLISAPIFQHIMKKRGAVDINATMVISMGIGTLLTEILSQYVNHGFPISFPERMTGQHRPPLLSFGLISISYAQVLTLAVGIAVVAILFWILYKTKQGRAFRAIAENPDGAKLVGIPIFKTGIQSYALTGILGGITATLMAVLLGSAAPGLGDQLGHKVLGCAIIAGLGNLPGGLIVALLLGIVEAIVQGFWAGSWSNAVAFIIMLVAILAKPKGVFGSKL